MLNIKQDRSVVVYTRGTNSMVLTDHSVTPMATRVVESLDIPTGSPVILLESKEPKAPKLVSMETKKEGTRTKYRKSGLGLKG
jgi:hypothetical protein